jgi:hypothetical protein
VKEIIHGIDKNHLRFLPTNRLGQFFRDGKQVKALLIRMALYSAKTFRKSFGVAEGVTWAGR